MKDDLLLNARFDEMLAELTKISCRDVSRDFGRDNSDSRISRMFSMSSASGKKFYKSLTDEQLLDAIKDEAERLDHSPSQKEMFWVWRDYIKLRFKKWPYALKAAGLDKSAGKCGKSLERLQEEEAELQHMLEAVRNKSKELGRIPHPKDMPELCEDLKKHLHTWRDVISAAGVDQKFFIENHVVYKIDDLEEEYLLILRQIADQSVKDCRAPLRSEVDAQTKEKLIARCGSWRNALYQIGLEPVMRIVPFSSTYIDYRKQKNVRLHRSSIHDSLFKILNPSPQTVKDLNYLKVVAEKKGRVPYRDDVPQATRRRLQESCGSWANALYQIGLSPQKK